MLTIRPSVFKLAGLNRYHSLLELVLEAGEKSLSHLLSVVKSLMPQFPIDSCASSDFGTRNLAAWSWAQARILPPLRLPVKSAKRFVSMIVYSDLPLQSYPQRAVH